MISVSIAINGKSIYTLSAVNVSEEVGVPYGKGKQYYQLDDDSVIEHQFEDGAVKLAMKMLKTIKEVK